MGIQTDSRVVYVLPPLRRKQYWGSSVTPSDTPPPVQLIARQTTTGFRTGRRAEESDEELVREFTTVQQNGFTAPNLHDTGHEFRTVRNSLRLSHYDWRTRFTSQGYDLHFAGPLIPWHSHMKGFPVIDPLTSSEIADYGGRAIKATTPTRSSASVATFLGELWEGLPKLVGSSLMRDQALTFRNAGSEYLNVQFGWVPFLSDLRKMVAACLEASSILTQYQRDSGRMIRRRMSFPEERYMVSDVQLPASGILGPFYGLQGSRWGGGYASGGNAPIFQSTNSVRNLWFSGAYTYHINVGSTTFDKLVRYEQLSQKLFGTRVTPEVLWELAPWSWLADWVGTIGTTMANASALGSDNLVLKYGYLMCHTRVDTTYTVRDAVFKTGGPGRVTLQVRTDQKERVRATPYGFGLRPADFSAKQWSILAALGMTKAPNTLR